MFTWLFGPLHAIPLVEVSFVLKCLLLIMCHHIGDFAFQSQWMAMEKGKDWEVMSYHVLMYTVMFVPLAFIFPQMNLAAFITIFASHFGIDPCKARWKFVKTIWQDQLFHYGILAALLAVGWL